MSQQGSGEPRPPQRAPGIAPSGTGDMSDDPSAGADPAPDPIDAPPSLITDPATLTASDSWGVCRLLAPTGLPGIGGSDLGFSLQTPVFDHARGDFHDRLVFLFGDTWSRATDACFFAREQSDDLQATLPVERPASLTVGPPTASAAGVCDELQIPIEDPEQATSWRPIRLFRDASSREESNLLDTTFLRTPVTGFSDGERAYGVFLRGETVACATTADCPAQTRCSADSLFSAPIGVCEGSIVEEGAPAFCLLPSTCADSTSCVQPPSGVCLAEQPFVVDSEAGPVSPPWFVLDPRRALVSHVFIASAFWSDRPEDYAVGHRFATHKFVNAVARTVAHFDPDEPSNNDYSRGDHTMLMWGRPSFSGGGGVQAPLFLLYQPLDGLLGADGTIDWAPRFFAGYDRATGDPRWSSLEADAVPLYGVSPELLDNPLAPTPIEDFDLVNHGAMTWVEPLKRWVMFYGGSVPQWLRVDRATGEAPALVVEQPVPGAIHMRTAAHPWGRARAGSPADEAWSPPVPVVTPEQLDSFMRCDDPEALSSAGCTRPRSIEELVSHIVEWATEVVPENWEAAFSTCMLGNTLLSYLYQLEGSDTGHLYGANIIDEWTADVSDQVPDLEPNERAVEIYWNVSTWNPYQVVLLKTQLRARVR